MLDRDCLRLRPNISESELMVECTLNRICGRQKVFGQVDRRLSHSADNVLGDCLCMVIGDFGQLPPCLHPSSYVSRQD